MKRGLVLSGMLLAVLLFGAPERGTAQTAAPRNSNTALINEGEYLAKAGDCIACHSDPGGKPFAGGRAMPTPFGTLYSSNISPDPASASANGRPISSTTCSTPAARRMAA